MTDHLVAFEYGTGQVWGYIRARSTADIENHVPEVDVIATPPAWMGEDDLRLLREHAVYASSDALDTLLQRRNLSVV